MATHKTALQSAYAEAQRTDDWKTFFHAMAAAIRSAADSKELDALMRSAPCNEGVFDERQYDASIADALIDRARTKDATALGWAVRAMAFYPYDNFDAARPTVKHVFLAAVSRHDLSAELMAPSPETRSAFAYTLGVDHSLDAVVARLRTEPAAAPRASMLMALAARVRRGFVAE